MTGLLGHLLLFGVVVVVALVVPLLIGRLVRPKLPNPVKDAIYECGEPTIGSSYIQFDLRYYVVALLFIVFDVEVAFFFPWAMVYGGATQLADSRLSDEARSELSAKLLNTPAVEPENVISTEAAQNLALTGFVDILIFFGVLLVGFAYVWKRGDLNWVRVVSEKAKKSAVRPIPPPEGRQDSNREAQPVG
jgi:NADH-quinone oxidoreductase subunit A